MAVARTPWPAPLQPASGPAIRVRGLSHWYGDGALRRQALHDIDLSVEPGEVVFLMGPSGCGKTTILTLVGALRSLQQGEVTVLGRSLAGASEREQVKTRRQIGFIFQSHNLHRSLTALENVRMGLEAQGAPLPKDADARCLSLLETVGLGDHAHKRQDKLSGGQRQRVAIARALVAEPPIVLADEPTAALDSANGHEIIALIRRLAKEHGMSVLMVTHDSRILDLADRIIAMEDGSLIEERRVRARVPERQHPALAPAFTCPAQKDTLMTKRITARRAAYGITAALLAGFIGNAQAQQNAPVRAAADGRPWTMKMPDGTEGRLTLNAGGAGQMAFGSRSLSPSWREGERGELCIKPMLVMPERCALLRREGPMLVGMRDGQVQFRLTRP